MKVEIVPCLADNYAYLVVAPDGDAAVVDPSEAAPVLEAARAARVRLRAIWNTHHHWEHTGGNEELCAAVGDLEVYGHASDRGRVPGQTRFLEKDDAAAAGPLRARVVYNPGHTLGAVSYVVEGAVFTGDTLFGAGCGRIFEGDPPMMAGSLRKLAALPPETLVYPGHEYTAKNLAFALTVDAGNEAVRERLADVERRLARGEPSVPSTIALERETIPFLTARSLEEFAERRRRKDSF